MRLITEWFQRNLSDPQVVILSLSLVVLFGVVVFLGGMLAPVLAAIVIAYLLEGLVSVLSARGLPRLLAVLIVFIGFMCFVALVLFCCRDIVWFAAIGFNPGNPARAGNSGHIGARTGGFAQATRALSGDSIG